ncbi:MAG: hypothetical protein ACOX0A_05335 [Thermoguttaceae bacterium]|jgi:hypothetical protein
MKTFCSRTLRRAGLAFSIAMALTASNVFATGNDMSGSCLNDVGRGAAIWGTSSEVTTYSEPYFAHKTPEIYRIPMTSEQASQAPETPSGYQGYMGNAMERLTESGTIFGTDGRLYEYTYVRGVEPRRIIQTRRVQKRTGAWVDEQVERVEWRPVLIRVLRPAGSNLKLEERDAALKAASANSPAVGPAPCEPMGAAEPQTFADSNAPASGANSATQGTAEEATPPVEGLSTVLASRKEEASVRLSTPSSTVGPRTAKPVLVLEESVRKAPPQNAPSTAEQNLNATQRQAINRNQNR